MSYNYPSVQTQASSWIITIISHINVTAREKFYMLNQSSKFSSRILRWMSNSIKLSRNQICDIVFLTTYSSTSIRLAETRLPNSPWVQSVSKLGPDRHFSCWGSLISLLNRAGNDTPMEFIYIPAGISQNIHLLEKWNTIICRIWNMV